MYLVTIQDNCRVRVVERTFDLEDAEIHRESLDPQYNARIITFAPQRPRRQWTKAECQRLIFLAEAMKQNLLPKQKSPHCFLLLDGGYDREGSIAGRLVWHGKNWLLVPEEGKERLCGRVIQAVQRRKKYGQRVI
ncbi:MAG: hypothetical protein SAJ12_03775 [Jaaginema sp. PMC 1079.18]|nr:hypothetical protein [Jaaginema sp. PMC 1080.18]MEC4850108.1 hypothetical protein [Jaaginema sp. PMC 1079.18]MEC4864804.1 hypothetical protein [Jaaginema sp. PMC 1078.18]